MEKLCKGCGTMVTLKPIGEMPIFEGNGMVGRVIGYEGICPNCTALVRDTQVFNRK